ncbi:MAG TPA: hypothetical protein VFU23_10690 [Gemmatimonadales bacterium]|nr:hypothetical protein [Gemmatimonadales bacterium]
MKRVWLSLMVATATFAGGAAAQSITGTWDATMSTPGGVRNFKIDFQVHGDTVTGTVHRPTGEEVPLKGAIKGKDLRFSYTINYNGNDLVMTMTVTVEGDTMKGTVDFGGNGEDEFSAKRAPQ